MKRMKRLDESLIRNYLLGQKTKHQINAQVFMDNPIGVADHGDLIQTVENELGKIAEYNDKLTALDELTELKW